MQQCVPCVSLKESQLRRLVNELILEMVKRKMKVLGELCACQHNNTYDYST